METYRQMYKKFLKEHGPCRVNFFLNLNEAAIRVAMYTKLLSKFFTKCKGEIKNNNFTTEEICKRLNKHFEILKIYFIPQEIVEKSKTYTFGVNESTTYPDRYNTIEVYLNDLCQPYFNVYDNNYIELLIDILDHEFIHREQAIRMKSQEIITNEFSKGQDDIIEYAKNPQEIMAFAFSIVQDSRMNGWDDKKIIENLKQFKSNSGLFNEYLKYFDKDSDTIKTLVKYMYQYLQ